MWLDFFILLQKPVGSGGPFCLRHGKHISYQLITRVGSGDLLAPSFCTFFSLAIIFLLSVALPPSFPRQWSNPATHPLAKERDLTAGTGLSYFGILSTPACIQQVGGSQ